MFDVYVKSKKVLNGVLDEQEAAEQGLNMDEQKKTSYWVVQARDPLCLTSTPFPFPLLSHSSTPLTNPPFLSPKCHRPCWDYAVSPSWSLLHWVRTKERVNPPT